MQATETEPLWLLKSIPYTEYRQTNWWRQRREAFIAGVVDDQGKWCMCCGIEDGLIAKNNGNEPAATELGFVRFHVHHVSYENLGEETDGDLALLCSMCHNAVHYPESHAAQHWLAYNGDLVFDAFRLR